MESVNYTYTKGQLELLAECMAINDDLFDALFVFFDSAKLSPDCGETLNWLRHAEHIKADSKYIEKQFDRAAQPLRYVEFIPA